MSSACMAARTTSRQTCARTRAFSRSSAARMAVNGLCRTLAENGLGTVTVSVGERLSYEDETDHHRHGGGAAKTRPLRP